MSAEVTEPNSLPPSPARAGPGSGSSSGGWPAPAPPPCRGRRGAGGCGASPSAWSHDALGRHDRQPAGHEVVAGVAVGDLEHVALATQLLDVLAEHDSSRSGLRARRRRLRRPNRPSRARRTAAPDSSSASTVTPSGELLDLAHGGRRRVRRRHRRGQVRPVAAVTTTAPAALGHLAHAVGQQRHLPCDADRPGDLDAAAAALLPVTRRARIFARSDMNRRSRLTSL